MAMLSGISGCLRISSTVWRTLSSTLSKPVSQPSKSIPALRRVSMRSSGILLSCTRWRNSSACNPRIPQSWWAMTMISLTLSSNTATNKLRITEPQGWVTSAPAFLMSLASPFFKPNALGNNSIMRASMQERMASSRPGYLLVKYFSYSPVSTKCWL